MSFTEDELQAFTTILEQRFAVHRQEMEQVLAERINTVQQTTEQILEQGVQDLHRAVDQVFVSRLELLEQTMDRILYQGMHSLQQSLEQLLDQRLNILQHSLELRLVASQREQAALLEEWLTEQSKRFEAIEIQTELPWDELMGMVGRALDERLAFQQNIFQSQIKSLEQMLAQRLLALSDEFSRSQTAATQPRGVVSAAAQEGSAATLRGIEQLERVVDALQTAMTANHALLSNQLSHHQQLPPDRAHPLASVRPPRTNGTSSLLGHSIEPGLTLKAKDLTD
jgi:hypothetical protein